MQRDTSTIALIKQLRQRLNIAEEQCSDEKLLRVTKGTLLRGKCELRIAVDRLRTQIDKVVKEEGWFWRVLWRMFR